MLMNLFFILARILIPCHVWQPSMAWPNSVESGTGRLGHVGLLLGTWDSMGKIRGSMRRMRVMNFWKLSHLQRQDETFNMLRLTMSSWWILLPCLQICCQHIGLQLIETRRSASLPATFNGRTVRHGRESFFSPSQSFSHRRSLLCRSVETPGTCVVASSFGKIGSGGGLVAKREDFQVASTTSRSLSWQISSKTLEEATEEWEVPEVEHQKCGKETGLAPMKIAHFVAA